MSPPMNEPLADPVETLRGLANFQLPLLIRGVAQAGVADALASGPRPVAEVAAATGLHPDALHRALRALASYGIFAETAPGVYGLTPLAEPLRRDHPSGLGPTLIIPEWEVHAWAELAHTLVTGAPAFPHHYGHPYFEWLARHPEVSARFDQYMKAFVGRVVVAALPLYDWPREGTIVDVGGGTGALIAAVLQARPGLRGILFDQPAVVAGARPILERAGVADRCRVVGGDFFGACPAGGTVYLLARVLHDWNDEQAAVILKNCRAAMGSDAKLLIFDGVIKPGNEPDLFKLSDVHMLVLLDGKERDEGQWRSLLRATGFHLERTVPTPFQAWIEALPV